jgi:hypothetical protein
VKGSGANLEVIRLLNEAPLISPKPFQRKDQLLEIHSSSLADFFWSADSKTGSPQRNQPLRSLRLCGEISI